MTGANILQDGLRSVLWLFCQFALWLMDLCYSIINDLATLNLGDFQFIWSWFRGVSALLFFFLTIRMFIYYIKATLEEDKLQRIDPLDFLQRIAYVSAILLMLPTMLGMFSNLTANLVGSIGTLAGIDDTETVPSKIVAAAGYNGYIADFDYETIDINEKENGHYVQFSNNADIVFLTFSAIISCVVFVFIGIQISQRMIGLLLKIVIAPFALSGLVDPEDNTFDLWRKLVEADFLTSFFQIVLVMVVMISSSLVPIGAIAKCIFFIGALMAVMNAPAGVAQLLGGDVGVGTAFQQMQSLMMLGNGVQLTGQAIGNVGAAATYLGGRAMGGASLIGGGGMPSGGGSGSTGGGSINVSGGGVTMPGSSGGIASLDPGRMTRDKWANPFTGNEHTTPARWASDKLNQSNVGSMINHGAAAIYRGAASRVSRPVTRRGPGGGTIQRRNAFMAGRAVAYGARDISHAVSRDMSGRNQRRAIGGRR